MLDTPQFRSVAGAFWRGQGVEFGHLEPQTFPGEKVPTMASKKRSGHCLTGPIAVRGAVPGEVLAVRFISLQPDTWGYTVAAVSPQKL
jgi:Acetamidase/Formamidase family